MPRLAGAGGEAAAQLAAREKRLVSALRAGHIGVFDWETPTGRMTWAGTLEELFGLPTERFEADYQSWARRIHPEDSRQLVVLLAEWAQTQRERATFEYRFRRADGQSRWMEARMRLEYEPSGRLSRVVGVNLDITDRKCAAAELGAAKEAAEQANRTKDQFIAVLSHELRMPLAPVLATVQLMEMDPTTPPGTRERLVVIRRNVELEARLIGDLLDLTRIARGKLELDLRPTDVHEKIGHVVQMCESDIRVRQLRLVLDFDARHHQVQADSARLQQILWNLLTNAVKFTPVGGTVWITTDNTDHQTIAVTVKDTGVGIAPDMLIRVFDAFEQGSRDVTRLFGGMGLGLSITKGLVKLHGGTIEAHSAGRGKGAVFTFELPLAPTADPTRPAGDASAVRRNEARTCRILLVEDHADTRTMMLQLLEAHGYSVNTVDSVASALRVAGSRQFDLLVCDIGLPDGSGLEIMRRLRNMGIKGIALSGFAQEEDVRKSQEAGFAVHLTKPVNAQHLDAAIQQLLA